MDSYLGHYVIENNDELSKNPRTYSIFKCCSMQISFSEQTCSWAGRRTCAYLTSPTALHGFDLN